MAANNTTNIVTTTSSAQAIAIPYVCVGIPAITANVLILVVLFSDRKLLAQSALFFGFTCSQLFLGLDIGISGIVRISDSSTNLIPAMWCVQVIYPIFFPLAFLSSALLMTVIGIERLTAVATPHWFRKWVTDRRTWCLVGIIFGMVLSLLAIGIWQASLQPPTTKECTQSSTFGKQFISFSRASSALGGLVAATLTISAMVIGNRRIRKLPLLSGESGKLRRQIQLTRAMLSVAVFDFCLVVIPNTMAFLNTYSIVKGISSTYMNFAFCVNAVLTLFSHLIFNSQFRRAVGRMIRIGSINGATVVPIGEANTQQKIQIVRRDILVESRV